MILLNKKFILGYVIYIGIIVSIYFFGKDFLLVFDNLKNFFLSINPVYYMLSLPISTFFIFIIISFLEKRGIMGVLIYLLIAIPILLLFLYYSNAKLSVDYLKSEAIFIILIILSCSCIASAAICEIFRRKEEELEKTFMENRNYHRIVDDIEELSMHLKTINKFLRPLALIVLLLFIIFFIFQNEISIKFFSDQGLVLQDDTKISIYFKEKMIESFSKSKYDFVTASFDDKYVDVVLNNKENNAFFDLRCNTNGCKEINNTKSE
ncbi:TPA: hypothetical protein ACX8VE_001452 [Campylobacter jejuni]